MTLEQRKILLINWIAEVGDESLISKLESIKEKDADTIPSEIIDLLHESSRQDNSTLTLHTSARDLLKKRNERKKD